MAPQPCGLSITPPSFVSSASLQKVYSVPASGALIKILNCTDANIDQWLASSWTLWCWSQHFQLSSSASFQSATLTIYLAHTSSVCQRGNYGKSMESIIKVNTRNIQSSHLIHEGNHLITGSDQVGQIRLLQKSMPATSSHLIRCMSRSVFRGYLLLHFLRGGGKVPWILICVLESRMFSFFQTSTYHHDFSRIIGSGFHRDMGQHPQHSWNNSIRSCGFMYI